MQSTIDILCVVEDEGVHNIKQLAKRLAIPVGQLETIVKSLSRYHLLDYDAKSGKITIPEWFADINREIEKAKPPTGAIILPSNEEVKIDDVVIGNFTKKDIELRVRLKAKVKEIAVCDLS
jgi:predicted transcriptional regulator